VELWRRESNWDQNAVDPDSGALGIPQVLGYDTAKTAPGTRVIGDRSRDEYGPDFGLTTSQAAAANDGSAYAQILWGIGFIADTYGGPSEALAVHDEYDRY